MLGDELAARVIAAVQNKPEAVKKISDALASGNAIVLKDAIEKYAGIDISTEEAQAIADQVKANPSQAAAYNT